jgi:hypothetical protein
VKLAPELGDVLMLKFRSPEPDFDADPLPETGAGAASPE